MKKLAKFFYLLIVVCISGFGLCACGNKKVELKFECSAKNGIELLLNDQKITQKEYDGEFIGGSFDVFVYDYVDVQNLKLYVNGSEKQLVQNSNFVTSNNILGLKQKYGSFQVEKTSNNVKIEIKGVSEKVLNFSFQNKFDLTSDELEYLNQIKVKDKVLANLLNETENLTMTYTDLLNDNFKFSFDKVCMFSTSPTLENFDIVSKINNTDVESLNAAKLSTVDDVCYKFDFSNSRLLNYNLTINNVIEIDASKIVKSNFLVKNLKNTKAFEFNQYQGTFATFGKEYEFEIKFAENVNYSKFKLFANGVELPVVSKDFSNWIYVIPADIVPYDYSNDKAKVKEFELTYSGLDISEVQDLSVVEFGGNKLGEIDLKSEVYYYDETKIYVESSVVQNIEVVIVPKALDVNKELFFGVGENRKNISDIIFGEVNPAYKNGERYFQVSENGLVIKIKLTVIGTEQEPEKVKSLDEIETIEIKYDVLASTSINLYQ